MFVYKCKHPNDLTFVSLALKNLKKIFINQEFSCRMNWNSAIEKILYFFEKNYQIVNTLNYQQQILGRFKK